MKFKMEQNSWPGIISANYYYFCTYADFQRYTEAESAADSGESVGSHLIHFIELDA
jgi:hypothetical protein